LEVKMEESGITTGIDAGGLKRLSKENIRGLIIDCRYRDERRGKDFKGTLYNEQIYGISLVQYPEKKNVFCWTVNPKDIHIIDLEGALLPKRPSLEDIIPLYMLKKLNEKGEIPDKVGINMLVVKTAGVVNSY